MSNVRRSWKGSPRGRGIALATALTLPGCYDGLQGTVGGPDEGASDGMGAEDADPSADTGSDDGDAGSDDGPGSSAGKDPAQPLHRLNRLEYNNTVRDLLGTQLQPANAFPPDAEANGFDNMAAQLGMSPGHLDRYVKAAAAVVDDALSDRPVEAVTFFGDEVGAPGGYAVGALWALSGNTATVTFDVANAGGFGVVLRTGAAVIGPAPAPRARLLLDGTELADFAIPGSGAIPQEAIFDVDLQPGAHTLNLIPTNFVNNAAANDANNIFVESIAVRSDAMTAGPGRALVYTCESVSDPVCAESIAAQFATRAWRRPITAQERVGLAELRQALVGDGETAEAALQLVLRAIMTSPKFLYRARTSRDDDKDGWLDPYVLASRLSYFLWSSMPDETLFEAAASGALTSQDGLREQAARMLADGKAAALVDGFGEQWLLTRRVATASPSPETYPEFDEALRTAMVEESRHFFAAFVAEDLPVGAMLRPDFAFRNDRLAEHYSMPPVGSTEMTRVPASGSQRRGLLSLSAWLTAQSDADHSSPIRRGLWVSDRLLCRTVPPPPPDLEFDPVPLGGAATVREQLEAHRTNPSCASCHALLDVLGIGLEEFDGVAKLVTTPGLDNLGELPDGRTFNGGAELAAIVAEDDGFVGCVAHKLLSYALGRPLVPDDADALQTITAEAVANGATTSAIVEAIVVSPPFRAPAPLQEED